MKNAQKPDHISLNTLLHRLKEGRYAIPDFQREFEWQPWDIQDLMRSIFLDYYIGSLLLWKGNKQHFDQMSCEEIYGFEGEANREYIVLDGQQRLTAIYYALISPDVPLKDRAKRCLYFLQIDKFMNMEYDDAFHYEFASKYWDSVLKNKELQFEKHIFPLSVIGSGGWELPNWIQEYESFWLEKLNVAREKGNNTDIEYATTAVSNAKDFGVHLKELTEQYQISYIELDQNLEVYKICDIFTKINSKGVRLDIFDLINALLKPKGLQLKLMWREVSSKLEFVDTEKMNVYILQVMSILMQSYCSPKYLYYMLPGQEKQVRDSDGTRRKEVLVSSVDEFETKWDHAVNILEESIKLLRHPQEFGVTSSNYLPYISILPAFAAMQSYVKSLPANMKLDAQRKIRHWYWASVFTNRYSGSVESTSARDFMDMKNWLQDTSIEPALIMEFKNRFKNLNLGREVKRGTSIYNGIFNLLVIQGARDWMTGNIPQHDDLDDHHIVPSSWGSKNLKGTSIHTILNRTPLTSDTNRNVISDRLPNEYLPELIATNGERQVRAMLETHFISQKAQDILLRDPFTQADFEEFISERQKTIQDAIENLLIKERLDLPPQLRDLDERIEGVELLLRDHIESKLSDREDLLPPHILQKVADRIQRALKKNPSLDEEDVSKLQGKLEYFDLRDLQDVFVYKEAWNFFEDKFNTKEMLNNRFAQLSELRNSIRHSRTVDEITLKEGEAAILWFEGTLKVT